MIASILIGASVVGLTLSTPFSASERVAVILSGGGIEEAGDAMVFAETEALAIEAYERQGYRVVLLGGVRRPGLPFSYQSFVRVLSDLGPTEDLRIDILAHGTLMDFYPQFSDDPDLDPDSQTELHISPERRMNFQPDMAYLLDRRLMWMAADYTRSTARTDSEKEVPGITHFGVMDGINEFQRTHPEARVEMHVISCFGGALAHLFRKYPNVLVFASAPATSIGRMRRKQSAANGENYLPNSLAFYYEKLILQKQNDSNKNPVSVASDRRAWRESSEEELRNIFDYPETAFETGRTPSFQNVISWCESRTVSRGPAQVGASDDAALIAERERTYRLVSTEHLENHRVVFDAKPSAVLNGDGELSPVLEERELAWCREHKFGNPANCDDSYVQEFKRSERDFALDSKCLERWRTEAPIDELENFRRLERMLTESAR